MKEQELRDLRESGKQDAKEIQSSPNPIHGQELHDSLLDLCQKRDRMTTLRKQGNEEAARQEAYLNGFLSQFD